MDNEEKIIDLLEKILERLNSIESSNDSISSDCSSISSHTFDNDNMYKELQKINHTVEQIQEKLDSLEE